MPTTSISRLIAHHNQSLIYIIKGHILWNNLQIPLKNNKTVRIVKPLYKQYLFDVMNLNLIFTNFQSLDIQQLCQSNRLFYIFMFLFYFILFSLV